MQRRVKEPASRFEPEEAIETGAGEEVLFWLAALLLFAGLAAVWSNHFQSSFHLDDSHIIVTNPAVHHLESIPRFFAEPRLFSASRRYAQYKPLLSTLFTLDYALAGGPHALRFQILTFVWFYLQLVLMYVFFQVIPGGTHWSAFFGVALFSLHPIAAETVNYVSQRGQILAAIGILAGLLLWIVWPSWLPEELNLRWHGVPRSGRDVFLKHWLPRFAVAYERFRQVPQPLYLIPVLFVLLAEPSAAIFAALALAHRILFEPGRRVLQLTTVTVLSVGYFIWQAINTSSWGAQRLPAFDYLITQPWVALLYLGRFFYPAGLAVETDLQPFTSLGSPLALAGIAGVIALAGFAVWLGRIRDWKPVSFGLWWFLLTLIPTAILPQSQAEANWRMYIPSIGLAFAVTRAVSLLLQRATLGRAARPIVFACAGLLAMVGLAGLGRATNARNAVWHSDESLLQDAVLKNPGSATALTRYALLQLEAKDAERAGVYLASAEKIAPRSAAVQLALAQTSIRLGRRLDTEEHFRKAVELDPGDSETLAQFAAWLRLAGKDDEAATAAQKALRLDPRQFVALRTLMDLHLEQSQWELALAEATAAGKIDSEDFDVQRGRLVAKVGFDQETELQGLATSKPSTDNYLNLSAYYFRESRYKECIAAARQAIKLKADLPEAWFNIASAYHQLGDADQSIEAMSEVVRLRPDFTAARQHLDEARAEKAARDRANPR